MAPRLPRGSTDRRTASSSPLAHPLCLLNSATCGSGSPAVADLASAPSASAFPHHRATRVTSLTRAPTTTVSRVSTPMLRPHLLCHFGLPSMSSNVAWAPARHCGQERCPLPAGRAHNRWHPWSSA
ncbi:hypothetical protein DAI22_06g169106 [Oryza sativa Japonica Group]|nr:hypothetical protein DAI22_06g169106 [Oryza sativa Japonica Group]